MTEDGNDGEQDRGGAREEGGPEGPHHGDGASGRAPVPYRHEDEHQGHDPRPREDGRGGVLGPRDVGRGDVRQLHALSGRGPLGAAARHPFPNQEHQTSDAAAGAEPRGLSALCGRCGEGVREACGGGRHRHHPRLRRPERPAQHGGRGRPGQKGGGAPPAVHLLHDLPRPYPGRLRRDGPENGGHGGGLHSGQGHGGPAEPGGLRPARRRYAPGRTCRYSFTATTPAAWPP